MWARTRVLSVTIAVLVVIILVPGASTSAGSAERLNSIAEGEHVESDNGRLHLQSDASVSRTETQELEFVSQIGGATYASAIDERHVYLGVGPRLTVLDIGNSTSPTVVGRTARFPQVVGDVALADGYAYVAAGAAGLRIVDVSNPADPNEIGYYDSYGYARGVAVANGRVYLAGLGDGLEIVDASTPSTPTQLGSFETPTTGADDVAVSADGAYAYVVGIGDYPPPYDGWLQVIDISSPSSPREAGQCSTPRSARGIAIQEELAYVGAREAGLRVIDVSNPAEPTEIGHYDTPGGAQDVAVSGLYAYVADEHRGLRVVDVSSPAYPLEVGFYSTPGRAYGVALGGDYVYVSDRERGLRIINVSAPSDPAEVGFYDERGVSTAVTVIDGYAYVTAMNAGLQVMDVMTPSEPTEVGFYGAPEDPQDTAVAGGYAYLSDGSYGVRIVDIADPRNPVSVGHYEPSWWASNLTVNGDIAYVADPDGGLHTVDVADPTSPTELGSFYASAWIRDVTVRQETAYVAQGDAGLLILDVSEPVSPTQVSTFDTPGLAEGVAVSGDYAYVADNTSLQVVDVSNPAEPTGVGSHDTSAIAISIALESERAYLADLYEGLHVLDVSTPSSPVELASFLTPGAPGDVALGDDHIYVADVDGGLMVLRLVDAQPSYSISGQARDEHSDPILDVTASSGSGYSALTDADGMYTITNLITGTYTLTPTKSGWTFTPLTRTVTVPPSATGQEFVGYPCVGPSGLDLCDLQAGDILLSRSPSWYAPVFGIGGTYFTHAMMYIGFSANPGGDPNDIGPRLAEAQGYVDPESDQVWETWLTERSIWTGSGVTDWAVVRPSLGHSTKAAAVTYSRDKAAESGVVFDLYADREDNKSFYCSKLVWRSYRDVPDGRDLEANRGIGSELFDYWVTPDDLYFGSPEVDSADLDLASGGRFMTRLWSPAHITLVDAQGRRTGYDATTGEAVFEIPGADYYAPPDAEVETITAVGVQEGWQIIVTGYDSGEYRLESMYMDRETLVSVEHATTESGQVDVYDVQDPTYAVYLPLVLR